MVSSAVGEVPALFSAATVTVYVLGASSPVKVVPKDDTVLVVAPGPPCRLMVYVMAASPPSSAGSTHSALRELLDSTVMVKC